MPGRETSGAARLAFAAGLVVSVQVAAGQGSGGRQGMDAAQPSTIGLVEDSRAARVDALFAEWDSTASPGCSVSVTRDGTVIYSRGHGMADLAHRTAITPATRFHVASISKQFAAAAIVLLSQEGKLTLDDPVRRHLPEFPDFGVPVTLRQLMHHTSGLRDQWWLLDLNGWRYSHDLITDDDVMRVLSLQKRLVFTPDSRQIYSNSGYTLLAQIVRRLGGKSFREFTDERIFRALGMKDTHFRDDSTEIIPDFALGYARQDRGFRESLTNFSTVGATGLVTTAQDLALWQENFEHPRVGGAEFVRQMQEEGVLTDGTRLGYAAGLILDRYRGVPTVEHGGSDAGYQAYLQRFPEQRLGVACLCNLSDIDPQRLVRAIADIYLEGQLGPRELRNEASKSLVRLAVGHLESKAGTYLQRHSGTIFRIERKGRELIAVGPNGRKSDLLALDERRFAISGRRARFEFVAAPVPQGRKLLYFMEEGAPETLEYVRASELVAADLVHYAGLYASEETGMPYRVAARGDALTIGSLKLEPTRVTPLAEDVFDSSIGSLIFTRDAQGAVSGFDVANSRGGVVHFSRAPGS